MRIGVNTRLLIKGKMDGLAWFSYEILQRMVKKHPNYDFIFFFDRKPDAEFIFAPNVKPVVIHPQARHPFLWLLFFEFGLKKALKKEKIDVFFSPDGFLPLKTNVKTLNIIHDINFEHFPDFFPYLTRKYYLYFFKKFAQKADKLATVSEFSKQDIAKQYEINAEKISVIPNAVAQDFFPINQNEKSLIKKQYTKGYDFFIFVGTINKRKNIATILQSFENYKQKGGNLKFVFAGSLKYWDKEMEDILKKMSFKDDVIFTDYISTSDMNKLLSSAKALVYPSLFEGFGVPILEAFACETPVITSITSSMPEVAGNAALLVNPTNVNEIADAMLKISTDKQLSSALIEKGKIQLQKFSWDKSEMLTWQELLKLLDSQND